MNDAAWPDEHEFPPPRRLDRFPDEPSAGDAARADEPTRFTGGPPDADAPADAVPLGPAIEGYVLEEEIHRGGQGVVYRGIQLGTRRPVALKVLLEGPFASQSTRQRFEREIQLAASLHHPNIVTILESGLSLGRYFFAMEHIDGVRPDRWVAQRRPTLDETLTLLEKVCLAVNFAHQRGVIHRDLKPQNILVDAAGEPHILDFGLAKPTQRTGPGDSTIEVLSTSGQLLGTVAYMSPEQAAGSQDVDVRSDVYSLGVIFYHVLVGLPPYPVDGPLGEVLQRIATADPANPRGQPAQVRGEPPINDELATILLKTLEKDPQRRYQTAGDLAADLRRLRLGEPIEAKRASGLYMLGKTLRRYRVQALMAGLILLMLVGSLITFAVLFADQRAARRVADQKTAEAEHAVAEQQQALREARRRTAEARLAEQQLRRALAREHIQRGDLALERSDLIEARDSYWDALAVAPGPAALWALRRYHTVAANSAAALLALEPSGPAALSGSGELAVGCVDARSIWVRQVGTGRVIRWVRAPGPITEVAVDDEGALAAAGPGWARSWALGCVQPAVAVPLPEDFHPQALYPVDGGQALLLVGETIVRLVRGAAGDAGDIARLRASPTGPSDFSPRAGQLAVPTSAGIELITVTAEGLRHAVVWSDARHPPRAVRYDRLTTRAPDDQTEQAFDMLAFLADALYGASATEAAAGYGWRRLAAVPPAERRADNPRDTADWELFDLSQRGGQLAFATRDGQIRMFGRGNVESAWRFTVDRLRAIRLMVEDRSLVTLDDHGTLTRWVHPEHIEQRRLISREAPAAWAAAADGTSVLLATGRGRVVAYQPAVAATPRVVLRPSLLSGLAGGEEDISLDLSADGTRAAIRDGRTWRLHDLADHTAHVQPWSDQVYSTPIDVALSGDGRLAALLVRSDSGAEQRIVFRLWPPGPSEAAPPFDPPPFDFVGSVIRDMLFVPHTQNLLVVRSNGQLFLLDPHSTQRPPAIAPTFAGPPVLEAWLQIDAAPTRATFSRTGEYLAIACEDDIVRLCSLERRQVRHRITAADRVTALAFNPRDDVLLIRTADHTIQLNDPATGETIARWQLQATSGDALAAWIGEADALLLGYEGLVFEHRFERTDALVERTRPYARQREIARLVAARDIPAAWTAAQALATDDPELGFWTEVDLLTLALRHPAVNVPPAWYERLVANTAPETLLQLGHAAYDGERFPLAADLLHRGTTASDGAVDAATLARLAACAYLFEDYDSAVTQLAAVLERCDLDHETAPGVALQRVAALILANRPGEARQAALRIGEPDAWGRVGDLVATASARTIARALTGLEDESVMAMALNTLLPQLDPERRLRYVDDGQFFTAELARARGDRALAAVHYQRCIDLSRDTWPANWARLRLTQLAQQRPTDTPPDYQ